MIARIDPEACRGCGDCVRRCPGDVIRMDPATHTARITYRDDCQTCFICELDCPTGAITVDPFHAPGPGIEFVRR